MEIERRKQAENLAGFPVSWVGRPVSAVGEGYVSVCFFFFVTSLHPSPSSSSALSAQGWGLNFTRRLGGRPAIFRLKPAHPSVTNPLNIGTRGIILVLVCVCRYFQIAGRA